MNPMAWMLISFPLFLLVRGRLSQYVKLGGSSDSGSVE